MVIIKQQVPWAPCPRICLVWSSIVWSSIPRPIFPYKCSNNNPEIKAVLSPSHPPHRLLPPPSVWSWWPRLPLFSLQSPAWILWNNWCDVLLFYLILLSQACLCFPEMQQRTLESWDVEWMVWHLLSESSFLVPYFFAFHSSGLRLRHCSVAQGWDKDNNIHINICHLPIGPQRG